MAAAIGIIGVVASLAGTVVSAMGAKQQADAQAKQADYQAQVARNNEIIAQQQANAARQAGAVEAQTQDYKSRQIAGTQKAILGASGVDIESGSPLAIQQSQAELARLDALTVQSNAERKAWGFDVEASNQKAQAGLYRMQASDARAAGKTAVLASLIGGVGKFAGKWGDSSGGGGFSLGG